MTPLIFLKKLTTYLIKKIFKKVKFKSPYCSGAATAP
jgi:hypothetical protein